MYGKEQNKGDNMAKSYDINLDTTKFQNMIQTNYVIMENNNYQINDYLLLSEVKSIQEEQQETGAYQMVQISNIIEDEGLKEGYVLVNLKKLN